MNPRAVHVRLVTHAEDIIRLDTYFAVAHFTFREAATYAPERSGRMQYLRPLAISAFRSLGDAEAEAGIAASATTKPTVTKTFFFICSPFDLVLGAHPQREPSAGP